MTKTAMLAVIRREMDVRGADAVAFRLVDYYAKRLAETVADVERTGQRFPVSDFYCNATTLQDIYGVVERAENNPPKSVKDFVKAVKYGKYDFSHPEEHYVEVAESNKRYNDYCREHEAEIKRRKGELERLWAGTAPLFWRRYEMFPVNLMNPKIAKRGQICESYTKRKKRK